MRGDSLRDFYAKALALVGLGALAGVGAAVDYWPTATPVPAVASAFSGTALIEDPTVPEDVRVARLEVAPTPAPEVVRTVEPAPTPARTAPSPVLLASNGPVLPAGARSVIRLGQPPVRPTEPLADSVVALAAATLAVGAPVAASRGAVELRPTTVLAPAAPGENADAEGDLLGLGTAASAARRAGASVVTGGGKAGASIVDGLTFVSRSIRRLKFF